MRFSLTTLLLVAFWLAALILVWMRREPWALAARISDAELETRLQAAGQRAPLAKTLDGTRYVESEFGDPDINDVDTVVFIRSQSGARLYDLDIGTGELAIASGFIGNDWLVAKVLEPGSSRDFPEVRKLYVLFHRRFPEWWWGHLYRPEVWLALALTVALLWRAAKARRSSRASNLISGAAAPPAVPAQRAELP